MTQQAARKTIVDLARKYPRATYSILVIPQTKRRELAIACQTIYTTDTLPEDAADLWYEWSMTCDS